MTASQNRFAEVALQSGALVGVIGLMIAAQRWTDTSDPARTVAAIGVLLLAGILVSNLFGMVGLPHLTGYIAAGVILGTHVLHVIDHDTLASLRGVSTMALCLIALAGGLELNIRDLREDARSIGTAMGVQSVFVWVVCSAAMFAMRPFVALAAQCTTAAWLAVSMIWGVLAVSRSPSVTLAVVSQLRAQGTLTRFSMGFVMLSDVVVVLMMAAVMAVARPLIEPGDAASMGVLLKVGREILGSIAMGTTLGLLLMAYLRLIGGQIVLLLLLLSFVVTDVLHYLHLEPMLTFLTAGFVVRNLSSQGPPLLHAVEQMAGLVFVVFFATAGAHLDLPLLATMWPVALGLAVVRALSTVVAHRISARLAADGPLVTRWGWAPLISQAGLTLGLSAMVARQYPDFGEGLRALVISVVAINELVGPVLFELALRRSGEVERQTPVPAEPAS